eukprot:CAMPEP_0119334168 /NCGR_PEP_ID=MMETSP1333-20130426/86738_1 /TAXON_ID=418940 /ORGANISM="Scyphosphaera apsteinii, Strain RCC1455" /LENGTH=120 /DNA_ID=CAMNT_0007344405 /DNA_START=14 /DNA_END=376 /DNA_ORIENTATION=-
MAMRFAGCLAFSVEISHKVAPASQIRTNSYSRVARTILGIELPEVMVDQNNADMPDHKELSANDQARQQYCREPTHLFEESLNCTIDDVECDIDEQEQSELCEKVIPYLYELQSDATVAE